MSTARLSQGPKHTPEPVEFDDSTMIGDLRRAVAAARRWSREFDDLRRLTELRDDAIGRCVTLHHLGPTGEGSGAQHCERHGLRPVLMAELEAAEASAAALNDAVRAESDRLESTYGWFAVSLSGCSKGKGHKTDDDPIIDTVVRYLSIFLHPPTHGRIARILIDVFDGFYDDDAESLRLAVESVRKRQARERRRGRNRKRLDP